ncbi:hypothetical protein ACWDBD_39540 [Streptomyces sp. NPDC001118]
MSAASRRSASGRRDAAWAAPSPVLRPLPRGPAPAAQHRSADALATELKPEHARLNLAEGDVVLRDAFEASYKTLDYKTLG